MQRNFNLFAALVLVGSLVACGGGGGGGGGGDGGSSGGGGSTSQRTSDGTVTDSSGAGVSGATVDVPLGKNDYSTITAADGTYVLNIAGSESLPKYFTATVNKSGYLPGAVFYQYTNSQLTALNNSNNVVLAPITDADVLFLGGLSVTHLGDGDFTGEPNSQLQVDASGTTFLDSFTLTDTQKSQYSTLTIKMYARGVESTSKNYCDQIIVGNVAASVASASPNRQKLTQSSATGEFTEITHTFSLAELAAGTVQLQINSGRQTCSATSGDYDDFEFAAVKGHFN